MQKTLKVEIESIGIDPSEIIASVRADMDETCEYLDSYIFLTKEKFIILTASPEKKVQFFSGFPANKKNDDLLNVETEIVNKAIYQISEISEPKITDLVSGGLFCFKKSGTEISVCVMSNRYKHDFHKLNNKLNCLINNEPITEETEDESRFCPTCGMAYPDRDRQVCPHCFNKTTVMGRMLSFFKPYKSKIALMFVCILGVSMFGVLWPYISGTLLYDRVLKGDTSFLNIFGFKSPPALTALLVLALTMAGVKIIQQALGIIQGLILAKIVPNVVKSIKVQSFTALERLSIGFFTKKQTGTLMSRIIKDSDEVTYFFIDGLPYVFVNGLLIILSITFMAMINWKLALICISFFPILIFVLAKLLPRLWHMYGRRHRASRSMHTAINDNLTGARVVKAFGREETETNRFTKSSRRMADTEIGIVKMDNYVNVVYYTVQNLLFISAYIFGGIMVINSNELKYGELISFIGYISSLMWPLEFFAHLPDRWSHSMNAAQRICEILDSTPTVVEKYNAVPIDYIKGDLKLENVTFGYEPNKPVLKNISFHVPEGKMLGIVGKSGAGKTTLVNLISRLYDADEGNIIIDGFNVKDLKFADIRRQITMVSQETYIFIGTVAENIAYGSPNVSRAEIVQAAIAASAHDFICKLPDGYDTLIGGGQRDLSGGERQRISIARAILANPRILILDEATAAMDTKTERKIQEALSRLIVGRTTISIAHRLSTLRDADFLIVMENGKIVEEGTHMDLIHKKGEYFKLVQLQSKALAMRGIGEDE